MPADEVTVGGLQIVLDTIERSNALDHSNIRQTIVSTEERLSKQIADGFSGVQITINQDLKARVDRLDARIGSLENWRYWIGGGLAVIIILVTGLGFALIPRIMDSQSAITRHVIEEQLEEPWHRTSTTIDQ